MRTIGLIGGLSWQSSAVYYRLLNQEIERRLGGLHSATTVMTSVDFDRLTTLQRDEDWDEVGRVLSAAARSTEAAGADFLLMCTTAFHRVAEQVEASVDIPFLHLGDVVAQACLDHKLRSVAFLGTSFAMGRDFFRDRIASHGLEVLVPDVEHHGTIDRIIYDELVHGRVNDASRKTVVGIIDGLWDAGAEGVILGCTELEELIHQADVDLPVFPCTTLHVEAAISAALA
ncbi:aspartate/glutamate racemase family protein [Nocardioides marmoribigeumensis]|uniref:Aspartate racemase n=1 Tax=Nocardioides marmoribigeumensis TaxID=433649 RepID=A0ABU2BTK4_9ACTN|nr:amino acid racemase [Nocardioides marmoribigeumensis]MDR7361959.1 aspartate racemase [Nocardioides marmoribigeumensis]